MISVAKKHKIEESCTAPRPFYGPARGEGKASRNVEDFAGDDHLSLISTSETDHSL